MLGKQNLHHGRISFTMQIFETVRPSVFLLQIFSYLLICLFLCSFSECVYFSLRLFNIFTAFYRVTFFTLSVTFRPVGTWAFFKIGLKGL